MHNPHIKHFFEIPIALAMLAGCSSPKIMLHTIPLTQEQSEFHGTLSLAPGSWVTIVVPPDDPKKTGYDKKILDNDTRNLFRALVTPSLSGWVIGVEPRDSWYATTKLSYTYWDNSYQFKSLNFAFQDDAIKYIQGASQLISSTVLLSAPFKIDDSKKDAKIPITSKDIVTRLVIAIDNDTGWLPPLKEGQAYTSNNHKTLNTNLDWWYSIEISSEASASRSRGAISICTLFGKRADCDLSQIREKKLSSSWLKSIPISRCVDINLIIGGDNLKPSAKFPVKIADPRYVDMVPIPEKGGITMHTICGADLSIESGSSAGTRSIETIQTVLTEIQKLKTGQDAK